MRRIVRFEPGQCVPDAADVLAAEGMSGPGPASSETARLVGEAQNLFCELCAPVGVYADITQVEFAEVLAGRGDNAPDAVLTRVFPRAERLAFFACTVGARLVDEIRLGFERHDYAAGYVLDAAASAGAERLADLVQDAYCGENRSRRPSADYADYTDRVPESAESVESVDDFVLRYSPGYCGWHVSGQRKLFEFLKPEEIGITLRESFLMEPLKSISGVFVIGPREIHRFKNDFGYCSECRNPTCQDRIARLTLTPPSPSRGRE